MLPVSRSGLTADVAFSALVAEDEALIAVGLEGLLEEMGATSVVWAPRVDEALRLIGTAETPFSVAIVDWLLGSSSADAVVQALVAAGTPVLIYTGAPETITLPPAGRVTVLGKPARETLVAAAVRRLLAGG